MISAVEWVEIRARRDRNRLLGMYDPAKRVLRLFHRGEQVTVNLSQFDAVQEAAEHDNQPL